MDEQLQLLELIRQSLQMEMTDAGNQGDRAGAIIIQRVSNALTRVSEKLVEDNVPPSKRN